MKMLSKLKNLLSRKFLLALIATVGGIMGMLNCNDNTIALVTSIGASLIPSIVYIITEGKIDIAALTSTITAVETAIKTAESSTSVTENSVNGN